MIPCKLHQFVDERHCQDRKIRRTSWHGSSSIYLASEANTKKDEDKKDLDREKLVKALSEAKDPELKALSVKLFDALDEMIRTMDKSGPLKSVAFSTFYAPDCVVHSSGDSQGKHNYVTVLAKDKVFTSLKRGEYDLDDYKAPNVVYITKHEQSE